MGNFSNNTITDVGKMLLADVQAGAVFTPTRIVIGSGSMPGGATTQGMTQVIMPIRSLEINKKKRTPDGKCVFGGVYTNEQVTEPFYFRELALYAKAVYHNADGSVKSETAETLYSYGNAGATADYMPAYSTSTVVEKQMDLVVWVGNDAQVDLTIASGVYVTHEIFNVHASRHAIGGADPLTPADIGAVNKAGDTMEGRLWLGNGTYNGYGSIASNETQVHLCAHANSNESGKDIRYLALVGEKDPTTPDLKDALFLADVDEISGTKIYKIYGEHNKPTPADIGAVNKAGDTLKGSLSFSNFYEYFAITKGRTLPDGKTHFLTLGTGAEGSSVLEHYTCDSERFDSLKRDGRLEMNPLVTNGAINPYALVLKGIEGTSHAYPILHAGNLYMYGLGAVPASVE